MENYEYILFDLDGTLTDPVIGITNSVMYALKKYNIEVTERSELFKFIGPPLWDSFEKYYGFTKDEAKNAVGYYREYYNNKGIYENRLYDGIEALLIKLTSKGKKIILATSKPEIYARQILEHFDIIKYFMFIAGSNLDGTRVKKDEVITYALDNCKITDKSKVIMIGDREHDITGAKKAGVHSMGVLFGYGSREELENVFPDYIVETVMGIGNVLIRK